MLGVALREVILVVVFVRDGEGGFQKGGVMIQNTPLEGK